MLIYFYVCIRTHDTGRSFPTTFVKFALLVWVLQRWILLFLKKIDPVEPYMRGECSLNRFFWFNSDRMAYFEKEKLKNSKKLISRKKCCIHFCRQMLAPTKMVMPQKRFFVVILKKLLNYKKKKKVIFIFVDGTGPPKMVFRGFLRKNDFFRKYCSMKKYSASNMW